MSRRESDDLRIAALALGADVRPIVATIARIRDDAAREGRPTHAGLWAALAAFLAVRRDDYAAAIRHAERSLAADRVRIHVEPGEGIA